MGFYQIVPFKTNSYQGSSVNSPTSFIPLASDDPVPDIPKCILPLKKIYKFAKGI
jgi:hypothetical protein